MLALMQWQWGACRQGRPALPATPTAVVEPDLAFIHANAQAGAAVQPAVTWIGHATVLAQFSGLNLITDPTFTDRASPVTFAGPVPAQPSGLAPVQLPRIAVVLVSHNHYDHLDESSVRTLNAQPGGAPLFVVPLRLKPWLAERGIARAVEIDWWQSHAVSGPAGPVEIVLALVRH